MSLVAPGEKSGEVLLKHGFHNCILNNTSNKNDILFYYSRLKYFVTCLWQNQSFWLKGQNYFLIKV